MKGPIYGVQLIDALSLGTGSMKQAMPSRDDLKKVAKVSMRTAAGYEVLLAHYLDAAETIGKFPKTSDGVSIVPEMQVWIWTTISEEKRLISQSVWAVSARKIHVCAGEVTPDRCYSTKEAAEASQ